jgi:hypothetical protein
LPQTLAQGLPPTLPPATTARVIALNIAIGGVSFIFEAGIDKTVASERVNVTGIKKAARLHRHTLASDRANLQSHHISSRRSDATPMSEPDSRCVVTNELRPASGRPDE